jgi:hypothetical protein
MAFAYEELIEEFGDMDILREKYVTKTASGNIIELGALYCSYPNKYPGYIGFMNKLNADEYIETKIGPCGEVDGMKVLRASITRRLYDTDHLLTKTCETVVNIPDQFYQSVVLEKRRTLCSHILGASTAVFLGKSDDFSIQLVGNLTVELGRDLGQIVKQYLGMTNPQKRGKGENGGEQQNSI